MSSEECDGFQAQVRSGEGEHSGGEMQDARKNVEALHSACKDCNDDWHRIHH